MKKSFQLFIIILFFGAFILSLSVDAFSEQRETQLLSREAQKVTDNCVECHQKNNDEMISLFARSTHARRQLSCDVCHGGNSAAKDKQLAHAGNFIGKPTAGQALERCGSCHQTQLVAFKTSNHIQEDGKTPRVDCVQCHGAHLIGSYTRESNFAMLCSNCHGLEYLPELPLSLRNILSATDEVKNALNDLQNRNGKPTEPVVSGRRELRRTIAGIVHATSVSEAKAQEQKILEMGKSLKQQIQETKK
jgi:hypothetical protein